MPTRNDFYFLGSRHVHYSELGSGGTSRDTSIGPAHQRDSGIDNQDGAKQGPRHRFNSQHRATLANAERRTPTAAGAGADGDNREDIRLLEQDRCASSRRQYHTQASTPLFSLPRTATAQVAAAGVRARAPIIASQGHPDLSITLDEYLALPSEERHRLRSLLPPLIPLVPKEKPKRTSILHRLNPFRCTRNPSIPASHRATIFVPSESNGLAQRRTLVRRGS